MKIRGKQTNSRRTLGTYNVYQMSRAGSSWGSLRWLPQGVGCRECPLPASIYPQLLLLILWIKKCRESMQQPPIFGASYSLYYHTSLFPFKFNEDWWRRCLMFCQLRWEGKCWGCCLRHQEVVGQPCWQSWGSCVNCRQQRRPLAERGEHTKFCFPFLATNVKWTLGSNSKIIVFATNRMLNSPRQHSEMYYHRKVFSLGGEILSRL